MSKVLIGRQALAIIGLGSIESFEEDSPEARQVAIWYDTSRKEALSSFNFSFARRTVALALHPEPATDTWMYRYVAPTNFLRMWKVFAADSKRAQPFEISLVGEELTILTNVNLAYAQYSYDLQNTDLFSSGFTKALRYLLAHYIAPALAGENGVRMSSSFLTAYQAFIREAAVNDANSEHDRNEDDPLVIRVR